MSEFEVFLARIMHQDANNQAAMEAQKKIDAAKEKLFGVKDAMKVLASGEAEALHTKLNKITADYQNLNKMTEA